METEEIIINSTVIKFFDDFITADTDKEEIIKKDIDIALTNAIEKIINIE